MATLERDRFAELVVDETTKGTGNYQMPQTTSEFMTAAIDLKGSDPHRFYINAGGLSDAATLKIELLSHNAVPLPQFSGANAAMVRDSGFQTPVLWNGKHDIDGLPMRVRFKVTFEGRKKTDIRFSALYLQ